MDDDSFPPVSLEMVEALEKRFPDRAPKMGEVIDLIRHKTGQVSVVAFLRSRFNAQAEYQLASVKDKT